MVWHSLFTFLWLRLSLSNPLALGHFSAGFTLDTYAHITSAAHRQAAQTMGSVLAGTVQG